MNYRLVHNSNLLLKGPFKFINEVFDCLSGTTFARDKSGNWLSKMTSVDAYQNYLVIKGKELGVDSWEGELLVLDENDKPVRAHLFATHQKIMKSSKSKSQSG